MKKVLIIAVGLMLLALPALVCGGGGGASHDRQSSAAFAGAGCPDNWEAVRLGSIYHGIVLEVASSEPQYAEGSGDLCFTFEGQLHMINTVEAAWNKCGSDCWGIPGASHALCSLEGWVIAEWDGQSNHVCVKFEPWE